MIYHLLIALLLVPLLVLFWVAVQALAGDGGDERLRGCGGCLGRCRGLPHCEQRAGSEPPPGPGVR